MNTRQTIKDLVLMNLYNFGYLGFGELVKKEKCDCSRGALNRALTELFNNDKLIEKEGGRVGRYCLTTKGREKAGRLLLAHQIYHADTPEKMKAAFKEIKRIIEIAEKLPDNDLTGPLLSCFAMVNAITGFIPIDRNDGV